MQREPLFNCLSQPQSPMLGRTLPYFFSFLRCFVHMLSNCSDSELLYMTYQRMEASFCVARIINYLI